MKDRTRERRRIVFWNQERPDSVALHTRGHLPCPGEAEKCGTYVGVCVWAAQG